MRARHHGRQIFEPSTPAKNIANRIDTDLKLKRFHPSDEQIST
jgi:hypothetical protein